MKTIDQYSTKKGGADFSFKAKLKIEHQEVDAAPSISEIDREIRIKEAMRGQGRIEEYHEIMGELSAEFSK